MQKAFAASTSAALVFLAGMAAAFACSPPRPGINDVTPTPDEGVPLFGGFTVRLSGGSEPDELRLVEVATGNEYELDEKASYDIGSTYVPSGFGGRATVYAPVNEWAVGGKYRLEIRVDRGGGETETYDEVYEVHSGDTVDVPKVDDIELYTVERTYNPGGGECGEPGFPTAVSFPEISTPEVSYYVARFRESADALTGEPSDEGYLITSGSDTGRAAMRARLPFIPECVEVTAYTSGRRSWSVANNCDPLSCRSADADEWEENNPLSRKWSQCGGQGSDAGVDVGTDAGVDVGVDVGVDDGTDSGSVPGAEDSGTGRSDAGDPPGQGGDAGSDVEGLPFDSSTDARDGCGCTQRGGRVPGGLFAVLFAIVGVLGLRRIF